MAFMGWDSYVPLLDALAVQRQRWDGAKDFATFDSLVRQNCSELVGGEGCPVGEWGYEALLEGLREEFGDDDESLFKQIRLTALAWSAVQYGLGEEWSGYFISEQPDGTEVYAGSRFAKASDWTKLEVSSTALSLDYDEETGLMYDATDWYLRDGKTQVWPDETNPGAFKDREGNVYIMGELQAPTVQDRRQQHYDAESERWRRWSDEAGGFEYYHDEDGVWERFKDGLFYRLHSAEFGWLAYDEESDTWLDTVIEDPQWRKRQEVGRPYAAELAEAEVLEEIEILDEGESIDEEDDELLDESIEALREELIAEALEAARQAGLVPDLVSEEEWEEFIDELVLAELQS
jgi:hypothetical protein